MKALLPNGPGEANTNIDPRWRSRSSAPSDDPARRRSPERAQRRTRPVPHEKETGRHRAAGAAAVSLRSVAPLPRREQSANVQNDYAITLEIGFIVTLLVLIGLFRVPIQYTPDFGTTGVEQERVQMEEIQQTKQIEKPPPPPKPQIPVVVADDTILDDTALDLDATLDIDGLLATLPPPPLPEDPEAVGEEDDEIFVVVEQMPELIGGIASIQKEIRYPEIARQARVSGRVIVQFIVDKEGNVVDPVVIRGIGGGCNEEALRVVKLAKFIPGKQRGKPVRVRYALPITFKLR